MPSKSFQNPLLWCWHTRFQLHLHILHLCLNARWSRQGFAQRKGRTISKSRSHQACTRSCVGRLWHSGWCEIFVHRLQALFSLRRHFHFVHKIILVRFVNTFCSNTWVGYIAGHQTIQLSPRFVWCHWKPCRAQLLPQGFHLIHVWLSSMRSTWRFEQLFHAGLAHKRHEGPQATISVCTNITRKQAGGRVHSSGELLEVVQSVSGVLFFSQQALDHCFILSVLHLLQVETRQSLTFSLQ